MNFIKKVFSKGGDEFVHLQFQKFSRGEFRDRAGIKAKKSPGKYTIWTTFEFANELVRIMAEKLGSTKTAVQGAVITTSDLAGKLDFSSKKQFQGVKSYIIGKEMSGSEILNLLNEFPKAFFALSFSANGNELKIKAKAPKSAKSKNNEKEKPRPDFCKIVTSDEVLARSFVFEKPDFKEAEISHDFIIEQIVIPNSIKEEKDFAIMREKSLRKGKIIRKAVIDGKELKSEIAFEA
jgi:hypothetical protein